MRLLPSIRHFHGLPHFVIPEVCPLRHSRGLLGGNPVFLLYAHLTVWQSVGRKYTLFVSGRASWIPEYYLGDDEIDVVHPYGLPPPSFPQSFGRESSLSISGPASWIPEYYLGDDEIDVVHPAIYPLRHSRSLLGGNPVFLLYALPIVRQFVGRQSITYLVGKPFAGSPTTTSGMTELRASFPRSFGRESSLFVPGPASWVPVPDNSMGDDGQHRGYDKIAPSFCKKELLGKRQLLFDFLNGHDRGSWWFIHIFNDKFWS